MTSNLSDPGPLLSTHGKSRSFLMAWWLLASLIAGAGAFVLSLIPQVGTTLRFSGPLSLLYGVGFGALALGALIAGVAWLMVASQPTFYLHEHAVRAVQRRQEHLVFYKDIQDVFTWYGGFALRANTASPWLFAAGRIQGAGKLRRQLLELHVAHRVPHLLQELEQGRSAVFRVLSDGVAAAKSWVADGNLNHPTRSLVVTKETLALDKQVVQLQNVADFKTNGWTEKTTLVDQEGGALLGVHVNAIFSLDVFTALVHALNTERVARERDEVSVVGSRA